MTFSQNVRGRMCCLGQLQHIDLAVAIQQIQDRTEVWWYFDHQNLFSAGLECVAGEGHGDRLQV